MERTDQTSEMINTTNITLRPAQMQDAEEVASLINICAQLYTGQDEIDRNILESHWTSPDFDIENDSIVAENTDGKIIGAANAWDSDPFVKVYIRDSIHPSYASNDVTAMIDDWINERSLATMAKAPADAKVTLITSVVDTDEKSRARHEANGFQINRYFQRMIIEVDHELPNPSLPQGIEIKPMRKAELLPAVAHTVRNAFRDHYGHVERPFENELLDWQHWIETDENVDLDLWYIAWDGDEVAGVSLCMPKMPEDDQMGWVEVLGVRRRWRRQGIALALLHHSFIELQKLCVARVGLGVDAASLTKATELYRKAGMHPDRTFVSYERVLREGVDYTTQKLES
ncbi:MAG: GNAT family N-acetyltransferase [Chloroflexota bacterium]